MNELQRHYTACLYRIRRHSRAQTSREVRIKSFLCKIGAREIGESLKYKPSGGDDWLVRNTAIHFPLPHVS
jgi:hypothetical protein